MNRVYLPQDTMTQYLKCFVTQLDEVDLSWVPIVKSWRLNERQVKTEVQSVYNESTTSGDFQF